MLLAVVVGYMLFPWPMPPARSFELVAHRGVHQTFPLDELTAETCTATLIYPPAHTFLENTIPSMREAFARGATAVELDIHRTSDGNLVVFHDWALDCRTDGTGITNEQTLEYLQGLDIGYGYSADGGQTFPFRGKGVGMMPTLPEVLAAFPDKRFVIHNKDGGSETAELLIAYLRTLPAERQSQLYYWGSQHDPLLHRQAPDMQQYIFGVDELRECYLDYLFRMLMAATLSAECRQHIIGIPVGRLALVPGWPNLIIARAHQAGAKVFITDVDTEDELNALKHLPIDGIQTNRIEVIGPLMADLTVDTVSAHHRTAWAASTFVSGLVSSFLVRA